MPEQRYTATDQLANVIDAIQLGRKTGLLTVTRGEAHRREDGCIIFVSGQIARAFVGNRIGSEALRMLMSWTFCQFLFQADIPPDVVLPGGNPQTAALYKAMETPANERASPLALIPQRLRDTNEAIYEMEQRGLTRVHRHLFLLLDGQRSVKDLVVLIGRSPDELIVLLRQLEQVGLIRL